MLTWTEDGDKLDNVRRKQQMLISYKVESLLTRVICSQLQSASHLCFTAHVFSRRSNVVFQKSSFYPNRCDFICSGLLSMTYRPAPSSFVSVMFSAQAQTWCCWITSPQTAPPTHSTMGVCPGRGGAPLPLKTRWSIPKVCVVSPQHSRLQSSEFVSLRVRTGHVLITSCKNKCCTSPSLESNVRV